MAPILYMLPPCPPVRAVLMTAKELGLELELRKCNILNKEQYTEEYLKMNPSHTIPTLDDDGFYIFESAAIMGYLVGKYGKNDSLYPREFKKRALVDQLLHFSTQSFATFVTISRPIILAAAKKESITEDNKNRLLGNVEVLEKILGLENKFVGGDNLTIADFSFVAWVSSLNVMYPITEDRFPNVIRWWKRMEKLPSYQENNEGLTQYKGIWAARE
ncbi:hypothetical protein WA026_020030 [Henosepilachna vigintioctopunctata]|uniref:Glutathione S-transferase n=1 Tax=Henosepilachna vigintioctopunctata TaxID=420089 RepID=A0AAW1V4N8_9CUCU